MSCPPTRTPVRYAAALRSRGRVADCVDDKGRGLARAFEPGPVPVPGQLDQGRASDAVGWIWCFMSATPSTSRATAPDRYGPDSLIAVRDRDPSTQTIDLRGFVSYPRCTRRTPISRPRTGSCRGSRSSTIRRSPRMPGTPAPRTTLREPKGPSCGSSAASRCVARAGWCSGRVVCGSRGPVRHRLAGTQAGRPFRRCSRAALIPLRRSSYRPAVHNDQLGETPTTKRRQRGGRESTKTSGRGWWGNPLRTGGLRLSAHATLITRCLGTTSWTGPSDAAAVGTRRPPGGRYPTRRAGTAGR